MKTALVTTTIRVPYNLKAWRLGGADVPFYVIGDQTSPHQDIIDFLDSFPGENNYIHPEDQEDWRCSSVIGWQSVQRRNIGFLLALREGADIVITVDDDNTPMRPYRHLLILQQTIEHPFTGLELGAGNFWCDPARQLVPSVRHRGFPLDVHGGPDQMAALPSDRTRVAVAASLWYGDPDTDALTRIQDHPHITGASELARDGFTLHPEAWAPFNSQATALARHIVPAAFCIPFVGRYDDIWASYIARAVLPDQERVHYGLPFVYQERNEHDLLTDLENELLGMRYTHDFIRYLRWHRLRRGYDRNETVYTQTLKIWREAAFLDFMPARSIEAALAWCEDLESIGVK